MRGQKKLGKPVVGYICPTRDGGAFGRPSNTLEYETVEESKSAVLALAVARCRQTTERKSPDQARVHNLSPAEDAFAPAAVHRVQCAAVSPLQEHDCAIIGWRQRARGPVRGCTTWSSGLGVRTGCYG